MNRTQIIERDRDELEELLQWLSTCSFGASYDKCQRIAVLVRERLAARSEIVGPTCSKCGAKTDTAGKCPNSWHHARHPAPLSASGPTAIQAVTDACAEVLGHDVIFGDIPGYLEQQRDMLVGHESIISLIADGLGVAHEPHQTFDERLLEASCAPRSSSAAPKHAVTQKMYEAGMKYLRGRGTAWCCTDLYLAMEDQRVKESQ